MTDPIRIDFDDAELKRRLKQLGERALRPGPVLRAIGEDLVESTKRRFATSTGPNGERWAPNKQSTLDRFLGNTKGNYKKDGSLSKAGQRRLGSKKPLIGKSRSLSTQIRYFVHGEELVVGSGQEYAAMQQFGGKKSEFPHLWGDIPARPFLGVSDQDRTDILDTLADYLSRA